MVNGAAVTAIVVLFGAPDATDLSVEVYAQPVALYETMQECTEDAQRLNGLSNSAVGFMLANSYWWCEER